MLPGNIRLDNPAKGKRKLMYIARLNICSDLLKASFSFSPIVIFIHCILFCQWCLHECKCTISNTRILVLLKGH